MKLKLLYSCIIFALTSQIANADTSKTSNKTTKPTTNQKKSVEKKSKKSKSAATDTKTADKQRIDQNIQQLNQQIQNINSDIQNRQKQKQNLDKAIADSNIAIQKTTQILNSLNNKQAQSKATLNSVNNSLASNTKMADTIKAQINTSLNAIYQQIQYLDASSNSVLQGNASVIQEQKKAYLIETMRAEESKYNVLSGQINHLQEQNKKISSSLQEITKQSELTKKQKDEVLAQQQQKQVQAQQVVKHIEVATTQLNNLKEQQARMNALMKQIAQNEAKRKEQERQAKIAQAKAQAIADAKEQQAAKTSKSSTQKSTQVVNNDNVKTPSKESIKASKTTQDTSVENNSPFMSRNLARPVSGSISVGFGEKRNNVRNTGVLFTSTGSAVRSVSDGKVLYTGFLPGFGQVVVIDHGDSYVSIYSGVIPQIAKGANVSAGTTIANSGSASNQPMGGVYFELRHLGKPINPSAVVN